MIMVQPACGPTRCCLVASLVRLYGCLWHNLRVVCLVASLVYMLMMASRRPAMGAVGARWCGRVALYSALAIARQGSHSRGPEQLA